MRSCRYRYIVATAAAGIVLWTATGGLVHVYMICADFRTMGESSFRILRGIRPAIALASMGLVFSLAVLAAVLAGGATSRLSLVIVLPILAGAGVGVVEGVAVSSRFWGFDPSLNLTAESTRFWAGALCGAVSTIPMIPVALRAYRGQAFAASRKSARRLLVWFAWLYGPLFGGLASMTAVTVFEVESTPFMIVYVLAMIGAFVWLIFAWIRVLLQSVFSGNLAEVTGGALILGSFTLIVLQLFGKEGVLRVVAYLLAMLVVIGLVGGIGQLLSSAWKGWMEKASSPTSEESNSRVEVWVCSNCLNPVHRPHWKFEGGSYCHNCHGLYIAIFKGYR